MIDPKNFDDLTKRFVEALPPSVRQFQVEMEKNLHAALQATFAKLDLVTREEFEVQQGVLARTRAKLEELEKQVAELEGKTPGSKRRKAADKAAEPETDG
ncbi:MAG: accessory factor UbiK family protein [Candidatus Contendobacter sp.]|nr:accessory factor UbiK family protein [Candidatus Contendobacter sp.]